MAVGPIGNAIYTNQMTSAATSIQNAHNNRVDFQNMIAQSLVQEKEKEVAEVRPTEENQEVDPDREHQKNEADQETQRNEKRQKGEEEESKPQEQIHKLDILV
jgi:electron transfer flavoprotein alpha subunit